MASATSTGKDVLPRAAALLGAGMASDITGVLGPKSFRRPTYAGNAIAQAEVGTDVVVVTVRQTEFPAGRSPPPAPAPSRRPTSGTVDALGAEFVGLHVTKSARPDLTEAKVVVSGGRGMKAARTSRAWRS